MFTNGVMQLTIRYRVDLINHSGEVVAIISDFTDLKYSIIFSGKGNYQLTISGFDDRYLLFEPDFLVKVYMDDRAEGISWLNTFTGIHKTYTNTLFQNGRRVYTSFGPSEEEIIDKAHILYYAGTAQAQKTGVSSSVMYEYVLQNAGTAATVANGRRTDGTNPITNLPDLKEGPTWSGVADFDNLLETLTKIRLNSINQNDQIDFRVNHVNGSYAFTFEAGAIGVDRTNTGVTPTSNGLNGAGNVPVIFGPIYGNVMDFVKSESRFNEFNTIAVLGKGENSDRDVVIVLDGPSRARSPLAQRERIVNATDIDYGDTVALTDRGQAVIDAKIAQEKFNFTPARGAQILFRDYFPGDFITGVDFDNNSQNKQIPRVDIAVSATTNALIERQRIKFTDV